MKTARQWGAVLALCGLAALVCASPAMAAADGTIEGTVIDEHGDPIPGLTVCAENPSPIGVSECAGGTDVNGHYSITVPPAGYKVSFRVESNPNLNYVPIWYPAAAHPSEGTNVPVSEGQATTANATMQKGGEIAGTVTDRTTGAPIEKIAVCADHLTPGENNEVIYCARSDAEGHYRVKNLGSAEYQVEFRPDELSPGYQRAYYPDASSPTGAVPVAVTAGAARESIDAHLLPAITIAGTVSEAAGGLPLEPPNYSIGICALDPLTRAQIECAGEERGGHYVIPALPVGFYVVGFSLDRVEDGVDIHPDGFVRRFWNEAPTFAAATPVGATTATAITGINVRLSRGEEVWEGDGPGELVPITVAAPVSRVAKKKVHCKKGFRKVTKGGHARCVKIHKKKRHHHRKHNRKARHR